MNISLKRGERIYINGAVLRVDRKVCIELLNDVTFLLENHVMQAADATTPLKQLYFAVQLMLISPNDTDAAIYLARDLMSTCAITLKSNPRIVEGLSSVARLIDNKRYFDALKILRSLFPLEVEAAPQSEPVCAA
jgi:flagellar biosynthesis repressor protein FlbT